MAAGRTGERETAEIVRRQTNRLEGWEPHSQEHRNGVGGLQGKKEFTSDMSTLRHTTCEGGWQDVA